MSFKDWETSRRLFDKHGRGEEVVSLEEADKKVASLRENLISNVERRLTTADRLANQLSDVLEIVQGVGLGREAAGWVEACDEIERQIIERQQRPGGWDGV